MSAPSPAPANRLPKRITPCPIVGAVTEVRFQTDLTPALVPGLIYSAVRERFPRQTELEPAQIPDALRAQQPELRYAPTVVMHGTPISLHAGPRSFFLSLTETGYPGWPVFHDMLGWVLEKVRPLNLIKVPERLGLRYTDFFTRPLIECLQVDLLIGGRSELDQPLQVFSLLPRKGHVCRIHVSNHAVLQTPQGAKQGCLLDVDLGFGAEPSQFWETSLPLFEQAHTVQKEVFFLELLKPDFLASLNPEY